MSSKRRWRDYRTATGRRPVKDYLSTVPAGDVVEITAAMKEVAVVGLRAARHLVDDIYEVRADGEAQSYRVLFAPEGARGQVLLALEGFSKKTQKTPPAKIRLAQRRLVDWRRRRLR